MTLKKFQLDFVQQWSVELKGWVLDCWLCADFSEGSKLEQGPKQKDNEQMGRAGECLQERMLKKKKKEKSDNTQQ